MGNMKDPPVLDNRVLKLLFKGMVRVHIEYAAPVWCPESRGRVENMERVQRYSKGAPGSEIFTI